MKYIYLVLLCVILTGCYSSNTFYSLTPADNVNNYWSNGVEYMQQEKEGVNLAIAFLEYVENEYVLHLVIDNFRDTAVIFNPVCSYLVRLDSNFQNLSFSSNYVLDPERQMDSIAIDIASRKGANGALALLKLVGFVGLTAIQVNNDSKGVDPMINEDIEFIKWEGGELINAGMDENRHQVDQLLNEKEYWEHNSFRMTTIEASSFHHGNIHLKAPYASYFKIIFKVGGQDFEFVFGNSKEF